MQARELAHAASTLEPVIAALQAQKEAVDKQIAEQTAAHADFAIAVELEKVPGIGKVTAATLASRLAARTFSHSDAFVAYCGLDVGVRQSGKKKFGASLVNASSASPDGQYLMVNEEAAEAA